MPECSRTTLMRMLSRCGDRYGDVPSMLLRNARHDTDGSVQELVMGTSPLHLNVTIHKDDEIRWVNERDGTIQIIFLDSLEEKVNCQRGFGLLDIVNATALKPQKSASLCFAEPGSWRDTGRLDRAVPTGWLNAPGHIVVEGRVDGS